MSNKHVSFVRKPPDKRPQTIRLPAHIRRQYKLNRANRAQIMEELRKNTGSPFQIEFPRIYNDESITFALKHQSENNYLLVDLLKQQAKPWFEIVKPIQELIANFPDDAATILHLYAKITLQYLKLVTKEKMVCARNRFIEEITASHDNEVEVMILSQIQDSALEAAILIMFPETNRTSNSIILSCILFKQLRHTPDEKVVHFFNEMFHPLENEPQLIKAKLLAKKKMDKKFNIYDSLKRRPKMLFTAPGGTKMMRESELQEILTCFNEMVRLVCQVKGYEKEQYEDKFLGTLRSIEPQYTHVSDDLKNLITLLRNYSN